MTDFDWSCLNKATTLLEPEQRKLLFRVFSACEEFGVPFNDAMLLCHNDPWSLPPPIYWSVRAADDAGIWEQIIWLCADEPELPSH